MLKRVVVPLMGLVFSTGIAGGCGEPARWEQASAEQRPAVEQRRLAGPTPAPSQASQSPAPLPGAYFARRGKLATPRTVSLPNGGEYLDLRGRETNVRLVERLPDGKVRHICGDAPGALRPVAPQVRTTEGGNP